VVRNPAPLNLVPTWKIENAMHIQPHPPEIHTGFIRRRCRNPRCGVKLKVNTANARDAFCCPGCFERYFHSRCLICERPISRKTGCRQVCSRRRCRDQFYRHKERFLPGWYLASVLRHNASRNPTKLGLQIGIKGSRAFRQIAGPELSLTSFRLAALPLHPELAARFARANAHEAKSRERAKRKAARTAIIKRWHPPVNVVGGHKFSGALTIDLSPTDPPRQWAITSRWKPTGAGAEMPNIPVDANQFLQ
jgi:hypothetical protein